MKRIIIIAVLAYLVYYLYNKKNAGASASKKGTENNLDMKLYTAIEAVTGTKKVTDPSPAEPSLVDPVGTSNANIVALQAQSKMWAQEGEIRRASSEAIRIANEALIPHQPNLLDRLLERQASAIVEERTPALTGDTPYWMPNQEMIYPHGFDQYNTL